MLQQIKLKPWATRVYALLSARNIGLVFVILCYVLCLAYFFSYKTIDVHNNVDGSWVLSLSGLRHSPEDIGSEVFYTYGPLFERLATYPVASDGPQVFVISALLFSIVLVGGVLGLLKFWRSSSGHQLLIGTLVIFAGYVVLTISQLDTLYYISLLTAVIMAGRMPDSISRAIILCGIALFSLYKVSFSLAFLIVLPAAFLVTLKLKGLRVSVAQYLFALICYIAMFYALVGSLSANFFKYLHTGVINSAAYNEFMSLGYAENKRIVLLFGTLFFISISTSLVYVLLKRRAGLHANALLAVGLIYFVSFLVFKQSVVRSDYHLLSLTPLLPLILSAPIILILDNVKRLQKNMRQGLTMAFLALCFACFVGNVLLVQRLFDDPSVQYTKTRVSLVREAITAQPFSYSSFQDKQRGTDDRLNARAYEITHIKKQLDEQYPGRQLLMYGNTTLFAELFRGERIIKQAPFVQNYAAFPPQLFDDRYIQFLQDNPNDLLFVEETEASINERIPSHELNNFFMYILANYKMVLADHERRQYILERTDNKEEVCRSHSSVTGYKGSPLSLPDIKPGEGEYIKLRVDFPFDVTELALTTLVKKPVYNITLINQSGGMMPRRTTQSTLAHGITVNPLYLSYHDFATDANFGLGSVIVSGGLSRKTAYVANFEICSFHTSRRP